MALETKKQRQKKKIEDKDKRKKTKDEKNKRSIGKVSKKKKYGIFHTLVGWVGLKKSFSIKNKNKKHGLKMPKIA